MSEKNSLRLRVSVDVGYRGHSVAIGLSSNERVRIVNNLQADLQAVCQALLTIAQEAGNQ